MPRIPEEVADIIRGLIKATVEGRVEWKDVTNDVSRALGNQTLMTIASAARVRISRVNQVLTLSIGGTGGGTIYEISNSRNDSDYAVLASVFDAAQQNILKVNPALKSLRDFLK